MKVVIVDDALVIRMQLKDFFQNHMNYEVVAMGEDGREAVELYKRYKPNLVTLDLTMPIMGGVEALEEILQIDPLANILVVSAIQDAIKITKALNLGAKGYIQKPLELHSNEFIEGLKEDIQDAIQPWS